MIDRNREGNALREEFSVLGSTGNVSPWHVLWFSLSVSLSLIDPEGVYYSHRQETFLQLYVAAHSALCR